MGANTSIEWTHHSFSPWWGCQRVSPGCEHCYAETFDKRVSGKEKAHWGPTAPRRFFGEQHWNEPLKWNAAALKAGVRHRVFCSSMADVFEDRPELVKVRRDLFALIRATRALNWLVLTKRPENIARLWPRLYHCKKQGILVDCPPPGEAWPNVWLGTTVEDQQRANERIPALLDVPAAVRFLSCEPLLEAVAISGLGLGIDWVIAGGESGHGARPMNVEWARSLRDQCAAAGVPYLLKQWGEHNFKGERVGKKIAGRLLDGVLHDAYPDQERA